MDELSSLAEDAQHLGLLLCLGTSGEQATEPTRRQGRELGLRQGKDKLAFK